MIILIILTIAVIFAIYRVRRSTPKAKTTVEQVQKIDSYYLPTFSDQCKFTLLQTEHAPFSVLNPVHGSQQQLHSEIQFSPGHDSNNRIIPSYAPLEVAADTVRQQSADLAHPTFYENTMILAQQSSVYEDDVFIWWKLPAAKLPTIRPSELNIWPTFLPLDLCQPSKYLNPHPFRK